MLTLATRRRTLPAKWWGRTMWSVEAARKKLFRRAACASGSAIKRSYCGSRCSLLPPPPDSISAAGCQPGWSGVEQTGKTPLLGREESKDQGPDLLLGIKNPWYLLQLNPPNFSPVLVGKTCWSFCL